MHVPAHGCRAIGVEGVVRAAGGTTITTGSPLQAAEWLDLEKGSLLSVRHTETSRELSFRGPGRLLPCDGREERFLLVRGTVTTATWAGARPGAEVLIATPLGVVRYGDAKLEVRLDEAALTVRADVGAAFIDGPRAEDAEVPVRVGAPVTRKGPAGDVKSLVARCEAAAEVAESLARAVLSSATSGAPLGEQAAAHVRARHAARTTCAIAAAAVGAATGGGPLGQAVARSEARWRGVPSTRRPTEPAGDPEKVESR